jgi:hypothetical protein
VACQYGALDLREHGVVESDDAGKALLPGLQALEQVVAQLGLDGTVNVAAREQATTGGRKGSSVNRWAR